ncbi:hypothetical protein PINS_up006151 [Pythium insidiosum]|nr:hypothetical protein PINS_up006151 [Pythium insidiosum]
MLPRLQAPASSSSSCSSSSAAPRPAVVRLKDRRERDVTQRCERAVAVDHEQRVQRRRARFLARWHHVRVFFASVSERLATQSLLVRSSWLRDWSDAIRDATATSMRATLPQLQAAWLRAIQQRHLTPAEDSRLETPAPLAALPALFAAFEQPRVEEGEQEQEEDRVDARAMICALLVLMYWLDGEMKMLSRWLDEFATSDRDGSSSSSVRTTDLAVLLCTPCASADDEAAMLPFVQALGRGRASRLPARDVVAFAGSCVHPTERERERVWLIALTGLSQTPTHRCARCSRRCAGGD